MREVFWNCVGKRINWRNLFLVGAGMTVCVVFLQSLMLPFPLNIHLLSEPETFLTYAAIESSSERLLEARVEQSQLHRAAAPVVLRNPSTESNQSLEVDLRRERKIQRRVARRRRKRSKINDDPVVVLPPPLRLLPPHLKRCIWSLPPHEALLYAKREIRNASVITEDPYLYAPVFRNLSLFQRSYEMMEMILKVYIHPDGKAPLFHTPHLIGIYASEGWFLKLMEENRQFITKDLEKAHLFYLPYGPLPIWISRKMTYIQHMKSSKYRICPMGHEVSSPRIIEAIYYECVPAIIADNFGLPLSDALD